MEKEYTQEQLEALESLKQIANESPEAMQEIFNIMDLGEETEKEILKEMGHEVQEEIESRQKEREEQAQQRDAKIEQMKAHVTAEFNAEIARLERAITKLADNQQEERTRLEAEIVEIKAMRDKRQ